MSYLEETWPIILLLAVLIALLIPIGYLAEQAKRNRIKDCVREVLREQGAGE